MEPITNERYTERAVIVLDSDATCGGCGRDVPESAIGDPTWHIDAILVPNVADPEGFDCMAEVLCPSCLSSE